MGTTDNKNSCPRRNIRAFGITDRGRKRKKNEDRIFLSIQDGLFVISDGMGGHLGGEVASKMVVEHLPVEIAVELKKLAAFDDESLTKAVCQAMIELNSRLRATADESTELREMGATVLVCLVKNNKAIIAHMGDSRAYLLTNERLKRLTTDHTVADLLLQIGHISEKAALNHFGKDNLTFYMGMKGQPEPDVSIHNLVKNDLILLCSDGLTNELSKNQIGDILNANNNPPDAGWKLVNAANESGGGDNISAILIEIE